MWFGPKKKPAEYGLYYDYPDDYFLQHAYSFWRFDFRRLYDIPAIDYVLHLRQNVLKAVGNMFSISRSKGKEASVVLSESQSYKRA